MDYKNVILGAVVSAIVSTVVALTIVLSVGASVGGNFGSQNRAYNSEVAVRSLTLATSTDADASNGSNDTISGLFEGSCNLSQSTAGSHAATTSKEYFCAATGARAGDTVIFTLPPGAGAYTSGASSLSGGFVTNGNGYATTSNVIGVNLLNMTGAATSSATQATTSARYLIVR